ncbi:hypothetical protein NDU88_004822 [Pleurodeles waltl]|uniref:Uncharacterized protein n=1 Tax=Pleurodeles waltl TaxID=8319 RepID=A0AAV7SJW1_PLEWA|nr:hypothetical protein NDU88_004822 [Pleurodeles waltl]
MKRTARIGRTLAQKTRKPLFGRVDRRRNSERRSPVENPKTAGPGEPMNEPPRFRRSVAAPGTEERNGERKEREVGAGRKEEGVGISGEGGNGHCTGSTDTKGREEG